MHFYDTNHIPSLGAHNINKHTVLSLGNVPMRQPPMSFTCTKHNSTSVSCLSLSSLGKISSGSSRKSFGTFKMQLLKNITVIRIHYKCWVIAKIGDCCFLNILPYPTGCYHFKQTEMILAVKETQLESVILVWCDDASEEALELQTVIVWVFFAFLKFNVALNFSLKSSDCL